MALKLSLLSNNAIEKLAEEKYRSYEVKIKDHSFKLSQEQKKSLRLMKKREI